MKSRITDLFASHSEVVTVDELTLRIRNVLTADASLKSVRLRGELQGLKKHSSGHTYFTLLGQEARVAGVLFRSDASGVVQWAQDGEEVYVEGRIDVYAARGSYQLYATRMLPLGAGNQARAKEALIQTLQKQGLFDPSLKRKLPRYPGRVAVLTSPTGAAIQDVLKVARGRFPAARILVIPTLVQGLSAPAEIVSAFTRCSQERDLSVVMLVRGGGGRDDLNPFDDERVVRAIASCPYPVITGVGHQVDRTLADMAADAEAPTPSAAAEKVFPDAISLSSQLLTESRTMRSQVEGIIQRHSHNLEQRGVGLRQKLERQLSSEEQKLLMAEKIIMNDIKKSLSDAEHRLKFFTASLHALSPLAVISRGFVLCRGASGHLVGNAETLHEGENITLTFRDGTAKAAVQSLQINPVEVHSDAS